VISEIMYHPFSPSNPSVAAEGEEYIELFNKGNAAANLTGWHIDRGIDYTFGGGSLAAGGYLVVAADFAKFHAKYPAVSNVVGGWTGRLSNSGEEVRLVDQNGGTVDSVTYADSGDWAAREHSRGVSLVENLTRDMRISGITRAGSVATVTTAGTHGLANGASVTIRGANESEYNGTFVVGNVTSTTFTVNVSGAPATPASGVIFTNIATNTATAVITGHGYSVGDQIQIFGADQTQYNQTIALGSSTLNTISFAVTGSPASTATGTIYARHVTDHNHSGWSWVSYADGLGKSLELVNTALTNNEGQNWRDSNALQGTPGAANSVSSSNIAPMILNLTSFPVVPTSSDSVRISAKIVDEATPASVTLFYRNDGAASFSSLAMHDDGVNGDQVAGDGTWSGLLLPQLDKTIVEFYVAANDGTNTRTLPGPTDGLGTQGANALYQVDDTAISGAQPLYRFIMTAAERAELATIGSSGDRDSNAEMNGTFIGLDGVSSAIRYNAGYRNRGHGTRSGPPNNYRVNLPSDRPFNDLTAFNFNIRNIQNQIMGSAIWRMAGFAAPDISAVQVRVNGINSTSTNGMYALVEEPDADFMDNHFPDDPQGNYYGAFRLDPAGVPEAELQSIHGDKSGQLYPELSEADQPGFE